MRTVRVSRLLAYFFQSTPQFKVQPSTEEAVNKATQAQTAKDFAQLGLTPDQFAQRTKVERGTFDKDTKAFTGANEGDHVRLTVDGKPFGTTWAAYQRMTNAVPQTQEQTVNPLAARAQQALQDPNASETAKKRAREILGVQ